MIFNPDKHKMGTLCIHNHEFENSGQSVRFIADGKCVVCKIERNRQRYQADPEGVKELNRKYQKANPEKVRKACRKWQKANPEKIKAKTREYYQSNKEKITETTKRWRIANPDRARELAAKWQRSNPEKVSVLNKNWREANAEKLDLYRREYYQANKERIKEAGKKRRQAEAEIRKETKERISAIAKMSCEELRKKKRELYLKKNGGVIKTYVKQEPKTISEEIADLEKEAAEFNQMLQKSEWKWRRHNDKKSKRKTSVSDPAL